MISVPSWVFIAFAAAGRLSVTSRTCSLGRATLSVAKDASMGHQGSRMFRRSGRRFADKNMRQSKNPERVPIPQERNTLWRRKERMQTYPRTDRLQAVSLCATPPGADWVLTTFDKLPPES